MSPFTASVSIRQCQDGPYLVVISNIPSVIIRGEQHIFPGLSLLCTPSLLITDPQLISSAQCIIYFKCFMVSVSAVVAELNLRHTPAICATRTSADVNYCTGAPNGNFRENICSEDDLRTRIFLAYLPLLGFSNIYKMV